MQDSRSYSVCFTPDGKFASRYPALAHLPFILDSRPGYHRLGNAYLVERGLGLWGPESRNQVLTGRSPTAKSMLSYAQWLANFLEWADMRKVDLKTCDYATHIVGLYQKEMLEGLWSRDGYGLAPSTVNLRVQQACDFLTWMADTGQRVVFQIPYDTAKLRIGSATSSIGHLGFNVRVRKGKLRRPTRPLCMPTDAQVKAWLESVHEKYGPTYGLMCETILFTAMRREEVVCLRHDTLPDNPKHWLIANPLAPPAQQQVRISIRYGTKGPTYGRDNGDKIGPERDILIPLSLAQSWDHYRANARNQAFAARMKGAKGVARLALAKSAVHLFLRASDGMQFQGPGLYNAWTGAQPPINGWSPHQGRHWWACSVLWRELKKHQHTPHLSNETTAALLESTALSIIRLQVQPQLGHANEATTTVYLRWVMDMLAVPASLEDDDEPSIGNK